MKIKLPLYYIPYGPAGHPEAAVFTGHLTQDKDDIEGSFYRFMERYTVQGLVPTVFFDPRKSLAENGYFILHVVGDEVSDEVIASLPLPWIFTPAAPGAPGRKLQSMGNHVPSYLRHFDFEVWAPGAEGCDHDFGLEAYEVVFKEVRTDAKFTYRETYAAGFRREGAYYGTVKCTRCGAIHALEQKS